MRKYGLASDNIADTLIVDVYGRVLTRETTGEDLFWALRGGGAASFGVVLAWKIRLVQVTPVVTVFRVQRSLEQEASHTVYWWQEVAPNRPKEIFIRMNINKCPPTSCKFPSLGCFWPGGAKKLVNMLAKKLPELKLSKEECAEMPWVESALFWANIPNGTSTEILVGREYERVARKVKSNYVKKPLSRVA